MEANIIRYHFNPPAVYNEGLGFRLFGKEITWRSVVKLAAEKLLDFVGATLDNATAGIFHTLIEQGKQRVKTYLTVKGIFQKSASIPLIGNPVTEDDYLAAWADNQLKTFCANLINSLKVLEDENATLATKIAALNLVAHKIDTAQDHFASYDFFDLTDEGVDYRSALLAIAFEPIYTVVKAYVEQLNLVTYASSFNPQGTGFAPLFPTTPLTAVPTEDFRARAGTNTGAPAVTAPGNGASTPTAPAASATIPKGNGSVPKPAITPQSAGSTTSAAAAAIATAQGQPKTVTRVGETKDNTGLYIGGGIAVAALIYAMTRNNSRPGLSGPKRRRYKRK